MKTIVALFVMAIACASWASETKPDDTAQAEALIQKQKQEYLAWYYGAAPIVQQNEALKQRQFERDQERKEQIANDREMAWYRAETERRYAEAAQQQANAAYNNRFWW